MYMVIFAARSETFDNPFNGYLATGWCCAFARALDT